MAHDEPEIGDTMKGDAPAHMVAVGAGRYANYQVRPPPTFRAISSEAA